MYTNITRLDLEEAILGNHELYNSLSLIGDKLRVIYTALGWTHMTDEFSKADNVVEELTQNVLEGLNGVEEECRVATAGLEVFGYWEEENLCLEYSFRL